MILSRLPAAALSFLTVLMPPGAGSAEVQVRVTQEEYSVSGKDGAAIMRQIRRKGPTHGTIGRAIAQTRYTLDYGYDSAAAHGRCHVIDPWVRLGIVFVYPRLDGAVSPELRQRWEAFLEGAKAHEKGHAELAVEMAEAVDAALRQASFPGSKGCTSLKAAVDREVRRIFGAHEARQRKFDRTEHRQGGPVERIVDSLKGEAARAYQRPGR